MKKHWGWGLADSALTEQQVRDTVPLVIDQLGFGGADVQMPVPLESAHLPSPRLKPGALDDISVADRRNRAVHALGKAYRDVVRGFRGDFASAPDFVAYPRSERDVERVLEWAGTQHAAVIPYGGGTSVVGGVEPRGLEGYNGVVSLDVSHMDRVLEVDVASRAASVQAGAAGPIVEEQLKQRGLTTRFFPQSFEFSTVGGWIATRAGGHYASGPTHIDDMVESIRALTPHGLWESRRLPASGAGPSPDRLLLGSEGALGVITQAWLRVVPRPEYKQSTSLRLPDFAAGCEALREVLQAGLTPANCRLIDGAEAPGDDPRPLLVLGFEGSLPVAAELSAAQRICRRHGADEIGESTADSWRGAFLQAPYLRDILVSVGVMAETFETATTWDRLDGLIADVRAAAQSAVLEVCGHPGRVTCRLTHVYTDGAAPYFTVLAPVARGQEIDSWDAIKVRVSDALIAAGGTITHHHGVGRDHRPWYDQQRPDPFAAVLRAAKDTVDPAGLLNPGVLVSPAARRASH
jgi:alkyldihydroxyacetonephosphate synthase